MFEHDNLDKINTHTLRHAFERSGITLGELSHNMGWISKGKPDTTRAQRTMSYKDVPYDLAVAFVEACHFDPVDYGL